MNSPQLTRIEPDKMTVDRVRQVIYYPSNDEKPRLLVGLLKQMDPRRSMVFVNTRRAAEDVELLLRGNGINAAAISGDVPQHKRLRMLNDFHEGSLAVLIGTDVASRGLHIPDVSHVFNYDLPQDPEDYVHRIGRTARAGTDGDAISFGCEEYVVSLPDIEAYINRKLPVATVTAELLAELQPSAPRPKRETPHRDRKGGQRHQKPAHGQGEHRQHHGASGQKTASHQPRPGNAGNKQRTISNRAGHKPSKHSAAGQSSTQPAAQAGQGQQHHGQQHQGQRPLQSERRNNNRRNRNDRRFRNDRREQRQQTAPQRTAPPAAKAGLVQRIGRAVKGFFGKFAGR